MRISSGANVAPWSFALATNHPDIVGAAPAITE
jgi:hypothetical protein